MRERLFESLPEYLNLVIFHSAKRQRYDVIVRGQALLQGLDLLLFITPSKPEPKVAPAFFIKQPVEGCDDFL